MNVRNRFIALVLVAQLGLGPALAQIVDPTSFGNNNNNFSTSGVSGISNLKIVDQAPDGSEVTLGFDYTYDGVAGPTAKIIAIIEKKGEKGISGWFGCDPAVVPKGSGPVSLRLRYFNDEFGVPPQFTSDRGRILFLNSSGISVVSSTPFIKTIKWGSPNAKPADKPSPVSVIMARDNTAAARKLAEEKAIAEAKAREEKRVKAEAEARRLADEKIVAEEKALAEAKARKEAEERAYQEALEQSKAKAAAKKAAQEKAMAEAVSAAPIVGTDAGPSLEIGRGVKSKVTNVDVVNRSIDRTQMTIGVEYDYNKDDAGAKASMGVDVLRQADPSAAHFFKSPILEVGKSRRNFVLFPVKFQPPPGIGTDASGFSTDKVLVYLTNDSSKRLNLFAATMLLMWRAPGSAASIQVATATHTIDFDDFKQNDASDGYVAIRYNLIGGAGRLRVAVYDSANPATRDYFATSQVEVTPGRGFQTLEVKVEPKSKSPTDFIRADTIEIEMVDPSGKILAKTSKKANMTWSKPRQ